MWNWNASQFHWVNKQVGFSIKKALHSHLINYYFTLHIVSYTHNPDLWGTSRGSAFCIQVDVPEALLLSLIFNTFLSTSWWQHPPYPWCFRADVRKRIHTSRTRGPNSKHRMGRRGKSASVPADEELYFIHCLSWSRIFNTKPAATPESWALSFYPCLL